MLSIVLRVFFNVFLTETLSYKVIQIDSYVLFSKHFESFEAYSVFKFNGSDVANKKEQLNLVKNASRQTKASINGIKFALSFLSFHNKKQQLLTRSSKPRSTFSKEANK